MAKTVIYFILRCLLLILVQVVIFNNMVLFSVAMAFVIIYPLIAMPVTWSTNWSMTAAFVLGFVMDIFSDTPGVNTMSCTLLAFVRKPVFHLYVQRDEDLGGHMLTQQSMGTPDYLKYLLTMTMLYCISAFVLDAFSLFNAVRLIECICASTVFTFIVIYAIDTIFAQRNEKRL